MPQAARTVEMLRLPAAWALVCPCNEVFVAGLHEQCAHGGPEVADSNRIVCGSMTEYRIRSADVVEDGRGDGKDRLRELDVRAVDLASPRGASFSRMPDLHPERLSGFPEVILRAIIVLVDLVQRLVDAIDRDHERIGESHIESSFLAASGLS